MMLASTIVPSRRRRPRLREVGVDCLEQLRSQVVALQQVAEVEDGALVGNGLGQGEAAEAPHRLGFVEEILHRGVAEVVAELDAVDAQHHRQRVGSPSPSRLRVVPLDERLQLIPGHEAVDAFEEQLTAGLPLLLLELHAGERRLMHGGALPSPITRHDPIPSLAMRVVQTVPSAGAGLAYLTSLETLDLSNNELAGGIPHWLEHLTNLKSINLSSNLFSGANFAQWLDELAFLEELYLGSNQLSGSIPPELGQLTSLGSLGLSENQFSGSIPDDLGQPGRVAR